MSSSADVGVLDRTARAGAGSGEVIVTSDGVRARRARFLDWTAAVRDADLTDLAAAHRTKMSSVKVVAYTVGTRADSDDGGNVYPGAKSVGLLTGLDERTVRAGLAVLRAAGLLHRTHCGAKAGTTDTYVLTVPTKLRRLKPPDPRAQDPTPPGAVPDPPRVSDPTPPGSDQASPRAPDPASPGTTPGRAGRGTRQPLPLPLPLPLPSAPGGADRADARGPITDDDDADDAEARAAMIRGQTLQRERERAARAARGWA